MLMLSDVQQSVQCRDSAVSVLESPSAAQLQHWPPEHAQQMYSYCIDRLCRHAMAVLAAAASSASSKRCYQVTLALTTLPQGNTLENVHGATASRMKGPLSVRCYRECCSSGKSVAFIYVVALVTGILSCP
jgi:hypothetical protein